MRTDTEISARVDEVKSRDFFGFEVADLLARLPFDLAKPYLVDDAKPEEWKPAPRDRESLLKEMLEYMPFAWEKANNM